MSPPICHPQRTLSSSSSLSARWHCTSSTTCALHRPRGTKLPSSAVPRTGLENCDGKAARYGQRLRRSPLASIQACVRVVQQVTTFIAMLLSGFTL
ncbi:hypothetical protein BD309DRAFT_970564 [Dichomitus squalens]|nr:hypothetical protein BD309DRAFT_970564 [Dichomitus squalens]